MSYFKDPFTLKDAFKKASTKIELNSRIMPPHQPRQKSKKKNTAPVEKQNKPAFYVFTEDESGERKRVGMAYKHKKGNGLNLVIGNARYVAFPPKVKSETGGV